jgi:hypothetical protein
VREYQGFTWVGWLVIALCLLSILGMLALVFRVF